MEGKGSCYMSAVFSLSVFKGSMEQSGAANSVIWWREKCVVCEPRTATECALIMQ